MTSCLYLQDLILMWYIFATYKCKVKERKGVTKKYGNIWNKVPKERVQKSKINGIFQVQTPPTRLNGKNKRRITKTIYLPWNEFCLIRVIWQLPDEFWASDHNPNWGGPPRSKFEKVKGLFQKTRKTTGLPSNKLGP